MTRTKIEWATDSLNPIRARNLATGKIGWFCEHASHGCVFCYSEGINKRLGTGLPFKPGHRKDVEIFLDEKVLQAPLGWRQPRQVFICSMTDLFADFVKDEWIDKIFAVAALTPQHTYLVLTKRSARMREYMSADRHEIIGEKIAFEVRSMGVAAMNSAVALGGKWVPEQVGDEGRIELSGYFDDVSFQWPLSNVWLGVSAEDQRRYEERKNDLRETPAAVRFFSLEPLLESIHGDWFGDLAIIGGESGPQARPCWVPGVRSTAAQVRAAGAKVFVKQLGSNVRDRNDAGFDGGGYDDREPSPCWPEMDPDDIEYDLDGTLDSYQGAPVRVHLRDRKGGDMEEWPYDLRIREMPGART